MYYVYLLDKCTIAQLIIYMTVTASTGIVILYGSMVD
jgi:hypothetical protein